MANTTAEFIAAIYRGHGTPWQRIKLTDGEGKESVARFRFQGRADDGWFYDWNRNGQQIRFEMPGHDLPLAYQLRRTMLMARDEAGRRYGPFVIAPLLPDRQARLCYTRKRKGFTVAAHRDGDGHRAVCGAKPWDGGYVGSVNTVTCEQCWGLMLQRVKEGGEP